MNRGNVTSVPPPESSTGGATGGATAGLFAQGLAHLRRGEFPRAVQCFTQTLAEQPDHAEALESRAEAYRLRGDCHLALADLDAALALAPREARVLVKRGLVREVVGNFTGAVDDLTAALELQPNDAFTFVKRGALRMHLGDLDAALSDLNRALQLDPHCAGAHETRAAVFLRKDRLADALEDCTHAIRLNPYSAANHLARGDAYLRAGKHARAAADYSNALRLDPMHAAAYARRAAAYRDQGQFTDALSDLEQALRLDPGNRHLYCASGLVHAARGDHASALADFTRAHQIQPGDPEALQLRAKAYLAQGNLDLAVADLDLAVRLDPGSPALYLSRAAIQLARGHVDEAADGYTDALRIAPDSPDAHLGRAEAWMKKGRADRAAEDCGEALHLGAGVDALLLRASALAEQGLYPEAHADLARALELDPKNPGVYRTRGQVSLREGEFDNAAADLTRALRYGGKNAEVFYLRATARQALEQHTRALDDLHQAVLLDARYTTACCNQRARLHCLQGEYVLALAEYAAVLQLDPANVTALVGKEEAERNLAAGMAPVPKAAPRKTPSGRRRKGSGGNPSSNETQVIRTGPALETDFAISLDAVSAPDLALPPGTSSTFELAAGTGSEQPDRGVPAPREESETASFLPDPTIPSPESPPAEMSPVGPTEMRHARLQEQEEIKERAARWAAAQPAPMKVPERPPEPERRHKSSSPWGGRLALAAAAVLVLVLLGAGGSFLAGRWETPLVAADVWEEFALDTATANKKYRGRFVQVKGTIKVFSRGRQTRTYFETPQKNAKWAIEFLLSQADRDKVKPDQEAVLRGRLTPRKAPDGNLILSNATLIRAGAATASR